MKSRPFLISIAGGAVGALSALLLVAAIRWTATLAWLGGALGLASWVQAIGSVVAVIGALWIALNANAVQRKRDEDARQALISSAYMQIHNVKNVAEKSAGSLKVRETAAFWKIDGGGFIGDLYDQMNRLPIHETKDLLVMAAFENARSMLRVMLRFHKTFAAAPSLEEVEPYTQQITAAMEAMASRCGKLAAEVAKKLPEVPDGTSRLFSENELDSMFGKRP